MSSILTNLLIVQQMFCNFREAAVLLGRLPRNDSQGPRWKTGSGRGITLNTGYVRGETLCAELTLAQRKNEDSDKAEENRLKLAALASIKMPQMGDYFQAGAAGASLYSSKDFSVIFGFVKPGQYFGPIIDYDSYRLDSDNEFVACLMVEFVDRGKNSSGGFFEYHAFVKLTANDEALCSSSSGPKAKHSIWDDDGPEVIQDTAPTANEPSSSSSMPSASAKGSGREVTPGTTSLSKASPRWPPSRRQTSQSKDEQVAGDRSGGLDKPAKVVRWDPAAIRCKDLHQIMIDLEKDDIDEAYLFEATLLPVGEDPYLAPSDQKEEDDIESMREEEVNDEYLGMPFKIWESKEKEKKRKSLRNLTG